MEQNVLLKKENFFAVDIAKFILAFCVIAIHTCYNFFKSDIANTIINSVIVRIAVPFFFVASGFFFFRGIVFENGRIKKCPENRAKLFGFLKRTMLLYTIWAVLYFAVEAITYIDAGLPVTELCKTYALTFFLDGFQGHFWYLIFMIYAVIVLYVLLRFIRVEAVGAICAILFLLFLYSFTYQPALRIERFAGALQSVMLIKIDTLGITVSLRALYRAMGLLFAGLMCVYFKDKISKRLSGILALASIALSIAENVLLSIFSTKSSFSYTFFLLPIAFFGFIFLSKIKLGGNSRIFAFFRNGSSFIYCSHLLVVIIFNNLTDRQYINKPVLFAVIAAISLVATLIIVPLSGKLKFLKKLF